MKRPLDKSLAQWIRELIAEDRLYRFYKCDDWVNLRGQVMFDAHFECEDCAARGKYEPAYLVHHDREVRDYPELALSRYWFDEKGERHKQLWALCYNCHEVRHGRAYRGRVGMDAKKEMEIQERWPERW